MPKQNETHAAGREPMEVCSSFFLVFEFSHAAATVFIRGPELKLCRTLQRLNRLRKKSSDCHPEQREESAFFAELRKKQIPRANPALRNDSFEFFRNL
jgi:hypothetical protein